MEPRALLLLLYRRARFQTSPTVNGIFMAKYNVDAMYFHGLTAEFHQHPEFKKLTIAERYMLTIMIGSDAPNFIPSYQYLSTITSTPDLKRVKKIVRSLIKKGWVRRYDGENGYSRFMYFLPGTAPDIMKQRPIPGGGTSDPGGTTDPKGGNDRPPQGGTGDPPNLNNPKLSKKTPPPPPQSEGGLKPEARGGIASQSDQKESESPTVPDEVYDLLDALGLKRLAARYIKIFPEKMTVDWLSKLQRYIKSESDIRSPRKFAIAAIEDDKWSPEDDMKREPTKPIAMVTSWCQRCKKAYSVTEQHARDGFVCSACFYAPVERKDSEVSAMQEIFAQRRRNSGRPEWKPRTEQTANIIRDFTPGQPRNCDKCDREYLITIDMDFYCAPCRAESQSKHKAEAVHAGNS